MRCELYMVVKETGEWKNLGAGHGVFLVGEKKMNANAATKMAEKRAHVDAVLNCIPVLGELFTQDAPDETPEESIFEKAVDSFFALARRQKAKINREQAADVFVSIARAEGNKLETDDDHRAVYAAAKSGRYNLETGEPTTGGKCKCGAECPPGETKCPECMEK